MTLQGYISSLSKKEQYKVAIRLAKHALEIWDSYAAKNALSYRDTVVGLTHTVDKKILKNAVAVAEQYLGHSTFTKLFFGKYRLTQIRAQFAEPITALQDFDWEIPNEVQTTFYAVYNLIESLLKKEDIFGQSIIYISINQSIDAIESAKILTSEEIRTILYDTKNTDNAVRITYR